MYIYVSEQCSDYVFSEFSYNNKNKCLQDKTFVVGPAHWMFPDHQNSEYQSDGVSLVTLREALKTTPDQVYEIQVDPKINSWLRFEHPHLFSYRYHCQPGGSLPPRDKPINIQHCMNDMVLLPLPHMQAVCLQQDLQSSRNSRCGNLVRINTMAELWEYTNPSLSNPKRIAVKEFNGQIVKNPISLGEQRRKGLGFHLVFQCNDG